MRTEKEIQAEITKLQAELEQVRSAWPKSGDRVWYLYEDGVSISTTSFNMIGDSCRHNCFRTKAEAELEHAKRQMRWELAEFARKVNGDWVPTNNCTLFYITGWFKDTDSPITECVDATERMSSPAFKDSQSLKAAIDHFGDRLKVLFQ